MGGRKVTIIFDEEDYLRLKKEAQDIGLNRVSNFVRMKAVQSVNSTKSVFVPLSNYDEILGYVAEKKFGQIESFATFAMSQYMAIFPLTKAQKTRVEESIE